MDGWMARWRQGTRGKGQRKRDKEEGTRARATDRDKGEETRKKKDSAREVLTFQPSDVQKSIGFYTFDGSNVQSF